MKLALPCVLRRRLLAMPLFCALTVVASSSAVGATVDSAYVNSGSLNVSVGMGGMFGHAIVNTDDGVLGLTGSGTVLFSSFRDLEEYTYVNSRGEVVEHTNGTPQTTIAMTGGTFEIDPIRCEEHGQDSVFNGAAISLQTGARMLVHNTISEEARGTLDVVDTTFTIGGEGSSLEVDRLTHSLENTAKTSSVSTFSVADGGAVSVNEFSGAADTTTIITLGSGAAADGEAESAPAAASYYVGSYTNGGSTEISLSEGSEFKADDYYNYGSTTIHAEAGTTCTLSNVQLLGGSMECTGEGNIRLGMQPSAEEGGEAAGSAVFTVNETAEGAQASHIDISALNAQTSTFDIDAGAQYTLVFADEVLQQADAQGSLTLELILIKGYDGFSVDEDSCGIMLTNTSYRFGETAAYTLAYAGYSVTDAQYSMQGNDLVWTGTLNSEASPAVPEPTGATLSLLSLALLAARRRRR